MTIQSTKIKVWRNYNIKFIRDKLYWIIVFECFIYLIDFTKSGIFNQDVNKLRLEAAK
jgi:hypothetical protein